MYTISGTGRSPVIYVPRRWVHKACDFSSSSGPERESCFFEAHTCIIDSYACIDRGRIALGSQSESTCRLLPRAIATAMYSGTGAPRKLLPLNAKHHQMFPQERSAVARWSTYGWRSTRAPPREGATHDGQRARPLENVCDQSGHARSEG